MVFLIAHWLLFFYFFLKVVDNKVRTLILFFPIVRIPAKSLHTVRAFFVLKRFVSVCIVIERWSIFHLLLRLAGVYSTGFFFEVKRYSLNVPLLRAERREFRTDLGLYRGFRFLAGFSCLVLGGWGCL